MTKLTKKAFCDLITSATSVKMIGFLDFNDVEFLEAENKVDILTVIEKRLDNRLNPALDAVPDFTTGRTYKARSKDIVSSENTFLTYQNTKDETYTQYKTTDGIILNVLSWFDKWDEVNRQKIMLYRVKTA